MNAFVIAWVVTYLLHSTILVLGAWLLDVRWRDRPERMSAVWKTALVGGVLTATVQTGLGVAPLVGSWDLSPALATRDVASRSVRTERVVVADAARTPSLERSWSQPEVIGGEATLPRAEAPEAEPTSSGAQDESEPRGLAAASQAVPAGSRATVSPEPARPEAAVASSTVGRRAELAAEGGNTWLSGSLPWLVGALIVGASLGLMSVLAAFVALYRRLRGRRAQPEGSLTALLDTLRRRAGVERRVPLTVAPRVHVPMAVGVVRPEIVVPPQAEAGLCAAHQQSLLAHELAHVLRRDPAWRVLALLVERVLFFQPLNRLAAARLGQTAEYLCDDWAARHTQQPLALASCLTEIATWVARPGPVAATMAGPRSILGRRVHRLLQPSSERPRPPWLVAALGLPLLGLVLAAPGVSAHARPPSAASTSARVVATDDVSPRHGVLAPLAYSADGGVLVLRDGDGELVVKSVPAEDHAEPTDRASRRRARKAERQRDKAADKARRRAKKEIRKAFRQARRRGDPAPSRRELEAIVRRARAAGEPHRREEFELHLVVPGGVEIHGRLPVDVEIYEALKELEGLEELEALAPVLEQLEQDLEPMLEGLEELKELEELEELGPVFEQLEELGPMLEQLEEDLGNVRVELDLRAPRGARGHEAAPDGRRRAHPRSAREARERVRARERARARVRHDAERLAHERVRARARHDAERAAHQRARAEAMAARERARRQFEQARRRYESLHERERQRHAPPHEELDRRQRQRIQRELQEVERQRQQQRRRRSGSSEPPVVWRVMPLPAPAPAHPERVAPVAPPAPPAPPDTGRPSNARRRAAAVEPLAVWFSTPAPPAPPPAPKREI
ncbi:MAG: M56 family metallopeptidase [Myxococcota bacterium]